MGAPLNPLIRSGFVQAPRKGRILQLIPQNLRHGTSAWSLCPFMNSTWFFDILHVLCYRDWVTGSFHRLLSQNSRCGKITTVNQLCPPHT